MVLASFLLILVLFYVGTAYHNTLPKGEYPFPEERCGCARSIKAETATNCAHNECLSTDPNYCQGGYFGCAETPGMCPLPGGYRNGYCHEPYGTHKVCADTNKDVLDWFKSVGNDLSSVVAPGMGWCLCKHWTRGAICCHLGEEGMLEGAINFKASDLLDPDVQQIQKYIDGEITKKEFCCDPRYPLSGCTPDVCREPSTQSNDEQPTKPQEAPRGEPSKESKQYSAGPDLDPWAPLLTTLVLAVALSGGLADTKEEVKAEKGTCEIRENIKARGGKKVTVGKAKSACECHDLCKLDGRFAAYMLQRPKTKKNGGVKPARCSCYPGKNGKVRFPKKEDKKYISGTIA